MKRLDLSRAAIVPWELPAMDAVPGDSAGTAFCELTLGVGETGRAARANTGPTPAPAGAPEPIEAPETHAAGFEIGLEEGQQLGYAEGFEAGRAAATAHVAEQLRRLGSVVQHLEEPMRSLDRAVEEAVIAFALEVARWVVGSEVARSRDYLLRLIREAVARVPIDMGAPSIVLNAADAHLIRTLAPDLEGNGIVLIPDDAMEPGGCRVIAGSNDGLQAKDRRWHPSALRGTCEVDLTLASRWREAMFTMFEGEDD